MSCSPRKPSNLVDIHKILKERISVIRPCLGTRFQLRDLTDQTFSVLSFIILRLKYEVHFGEAKSHTVVFRSIMLKSGTPLSKSFSCGNSWKPFFSENKTTETVFTGGDRLFTSYSDICISGIMKSRFPQRNKMKKTKIIIAPIYDVSIRS